MTLRPPTYERSCASHERMRECWHPDNKLNPRQVYTGTNKAYKFICDKCNYPFTARPNHIHYLHRWCTCENDKESIESEGSDIYVPPRCIIS